MRNINITNTTNNVLINLIDCANVAVAGMLRAGFLALKRLYAAFGWESLQVQAAAIAPPVPQHHGVRPVSLCSPLSRFERTTSTGSAWRPAGLVGLSNG